MDKGDLDRLGYGLLTVGVVLGLFFSWRNDVNIEKVNKKQTDFIIRQCDREKFRNRIAIDFLQRDRVRVQLQKNFDAPLKTIYIGQIDRQLHRLNHIPKCELP